MKKIKWNINRGKWSKLILELFVVFLGVTAGFVLNNWRMSQQESKSEQRYLQGFNRDVEQNIIELNKLLKRDSIWLNRVMPNLTATKNSTITEDSAVSVISQIIQISKMDTHKDTYEDITNSGNLNLIKSFNLKNEIINYNLKVKGVEFVDDFFYEYVREFVMPYTFNEFDLLNGKLKSENSFKSIKFSNVFGGYVGMVQQRSEAYKSLLNESIKFRKELNIELN